MQVRVSMELSCDQILQIPGIGCHDESQPIDVGLRPSVSRSIVLPPDIKGKVEG